MDIQQPMNECLNQGKTCISITYFGSKEPDWHINNIKLSIMKAKLELLGYKPQESLVFDDKCLKEYVVVETVLIEREVKAERLK